MVLARDQTARRVGISGANRDDRRGTSEDRENRAAEDDWKGRSEARAHDEAREKRREEKLIARAAGGDWHGPESL